MRRSPQTAVEICARDEHVHKESPLVLPCGAQEPHHLLKQLPTDYTVCFHQHAEVPVGESVANELARCDCCRHSRALVDQCSLVEVVALPQSVHHRRKRNSALIVSFSRWTGKKGRRLFVPGK